MEQFEFLTHEDVHQMEHQAKEAKRAKKLAKMSESPARKTDKSSDVEGSESSLAEQTSPKPPTEEDKEPNRKLSAGQKLPLSLGNYFPVKRMAGHPIREIDDYYSDKQTFVVIARDKTIFRFSASKAFFVLGPLNPIRRTAIYILTHPFFSFVVLLTIIINCVYMARNEKNAGNNKITEYTFTAIYTCEALIKAVARGMILQEFTYLRDAWNWLDFIVIGLAYLMFISTWLGNLSALRTLRVLRALKTVTTIPGLKTIVGALMEAVKRLRDVTVLTIFVLSIFALIGLQIYRGTLLRKCVLTFDESAIEDEFSNETRDKLWRDHYENEENWKMPIVYCKDVNSTIGCPGNYTCIQTHRGNPNFGYTNFDNFGTSLLCAFRLMTQDFWENLYQLIIRTNGKHHVLYFVIVILLGSFYLINVILSIVAMSYDEVQKQDIADEEEEEQEKKEEEERREQAIEDALRKSSSAMSELSYMELYHLNDAANRGDERISVRSSEWRSGIRTRSFHLKRQEPLSHSVPASPVHKKQKQGHQSHATSNAPHLDLTTWTPSKTIEPPSYELATTQDIFNIPFVDDAPHPELSASSTILATVPRVSPRPSKRSLVTHPTKTALLQFIASSDSRATDGVHEARRQLIHYNESLQPSAHTLASSRGETHPPPLNVEVKRRSSEMTKTCDSSADLSVEPRDVIVLQTLVDDVTSGRRPPTVTSLHPEEKVSKMKILQDKFLEHFCSWTCCRCWLKFETIVAFIILDPFTELFITLCILGNTSIMAIDNPNSRKTIGHVLANANLFFTAVFAAEAFLKLIALKPQIYFRDGWNIFDFFIVMLSLIEIPLQNLSGLSILRSLRLLRVLKLAKSWKTMNMLFQIILRTMGALGNLVFVLGIIIFIFAVVGMQLFGENYNKFKNETIYPENKGRLPRWHMQDFSHSFMIVFRVLCGEWIESMWNCMLVNDWKCIPFFLLTMTIGNLVVLNLFLALLLNSFLNSQAHEEEEEISKLQEAFDRIYRFFTWVKLIVRGTLRRLKDCVLSLCCRRQRHTRGTRTDIEGNNLEIERINQDLLTHENNSLTLVNEYLENGVSQNCSKETLEADKDSRKVHPMSQGASETRDDRSPVFDEDPELNEVEVVYYEGPEDCLPRSCRLRFPHLYATCTQSQFGRIWSKVRFKAFQIVEHKYFETFIIVMIVLSSVSLVFEDRKLEERQQLKKILEVMDLVFTVIFSCEMLIKWFAFGLNKYFRDVWCWLDFVIVSIALISLYPSDDESSNMGAFKAMRTLRALRPLRAVSRWEGMRVVVNALFQAIPAIFNVLLVCLSFWLIFSIMGVQLFGGKFARCVDKDNNLLPADIYTNETVCKYYKEMYDNVSWVNSRINFDHVLNGYLALFQVATYKGWIEVLGDAIDSTDVGQQPIYEHQVGNYAFFVLFIILGAFFTLNLFIGVIIDNFNVQKKKAGGSLELFMTEDQKKYYKAMKKISNSAPQKPIPKPKFKVGLFFYRITSNQKFDLVIMAFILLNTFVMCIEYYRQSTEFKDILENINKAFVVLFTGECVMKLMAQRWYYFKIMWNVFDFIIVIFSIICWAVETLMTMIGISPTLIRVVRVFRIGRVLRLVKSARGIRTLLFSLFVSLPALFNIALLLFLIMFIYAIVGMSFFSHVRYRSGIDETFNFESFGNAMTILFQISTSAGWNTVLDGLVNEEPPDCDPDRVPTDCGNQMLAVIYLVSYLIISFLVIVNMYIAVILENFSQATEDYQQGLTQEDYDLFYEKWENYDVKAKGFIRMENIYDFLDELEPPLGIPKPNKIKLATLAVPICKNDTVYCVDLLDALTRNFLGTSTDEEELESLKPKDKKGDDRIVISNTLTRQREHYATLVITKFIRQYGVWRRTHDVPSNIDRGQDKGDGETESKATQEKKEEPERRSSKEDNVELISANSGIVV